MRGDGHLGGVEIVDEKTGQERAVETPAVFSFIGAVPRTDWLPPEIERDAEGVRPDRAGAGAVAPLDRPAARRSCWRRAGPACSRPATCASGSVKRVASAVGEGSMAVQFVHEVLETM